MISGQTVVSFAQATREKLAREILNHLRNGEIADAQRKTLQRDEIARWHMRITESRS